MATTEGKSVLAQGRIVWTVGDLFKGKIKTEHGTQTPKLDQQGQPITEYGFGLAIPKSALQQAGPGQPGEIWAVMHEQAYQLYPSGNLPPDFSMKYKDGDGIDHNGQPFSNREGYAGHIVLACTTIIPIKFFRYENGANIQINEGIKCGDYVNAQLNVKAHGGSGTGKGGLYINPMAVQFLGYGKEIVNAPSGDQIFGNQAPPVPAGASTTPVAPQGSTPLVPGQQPGQVPAPNAMPGGQQAVPGVPQPGGHGQAQPNYGVLPQPHQPQPPSGQPQVSGAEQAPGMQQAPMPPQPAGQAPQAPQGMPGMPPIPGQG